MYRLLGGLLLFVALCHSNIASAHTRSESFSRWQYSGQTLSLRFTVNAREASRITPSHETRPPNSILANYLDSHIVVQGPDSNCSLTGAMQPLTARPGYLQVEAIWRCSKAPTALGIHAFFDLAAEHSHFASFESPAGLSQRLMTDEDQVWLLSAITADDKIIKAAGSGFFDYVKHGFRHISSGLDHVIFLLALLLICRRTRDIIWAVTGFTLGHSISLTLAVLGLVQVDIPAIEAVIGLTIALLAIERSAASMKSALPLAIACALFLLLLVPLTSSPGGNLGKTTLIGLALFSFCYLLLAHDSFGQGSFRVLITALFGLVHGFGFAGAFLAANAGIEVRPWSLAGFNIGVELGQLALVGVMLTAGLLLQRNIRFVVPATDLVSAFVCGFGVFWFIQRSFS